MDTFLTELAKSGPWAVVAGFLLWKIIQAWNSDRAQINQLISEFKVTLDSVSREIGNLARVQTRIMEHLEGDRPEPAPPRRS